MGETKCRARGMRIDLRRAHIAFDLAELAGLDDNLDPALRTRFCCRVDELLREEFALGVDEERQRERCG